MAQDDPDLTVFAGPQPARRVLVVEDEVMILMMVEDILADNGFKPVTAASLDDGLALLEEQDFDAALLDVNLQGVSVSPLAEALAARDVPFAFTTGGSDPGALQDHGARPVLTKPYGAGELVDVLRAMVNRKPPRVVAACPNTSHFPRAPQSLPSPS